MTDKIAEIRARHEDDKWHCERPSRLHADRATLLAEVEALTFERDEARAEVEKLRGSNKRLHHALFRIAGKAPLADDPWTIATKAMKREAKP